ncbi:MAG: sensor histidine kinase [Caldilineaceae bacterium]|nr:sensor histidine kinase [Caldilineaceae bacterium]
MNRKLVTVHIDDLLKIVLLVTLTATYVLVIYTLVVAVAVLPFADPNQFQPSSWLQPLAGHAALLDAFLTIVFGPSVGIMVLATVIVLLTTPRVYRWLRIGVNDLIDGQHDDAFALMATIHPHLDAMTTPQTILPTIAATIAQTLRLPYVAIATQSTGPPLEASFGAAPVGATIEALPLRYHETPIGELRVSPRRVDEPLSHSDFAVLRDLARQVGITLYAAKLTVDLQRSRTRLVTAREEERRRIRRDLHDGLGPTLANFAMRLEQAREALPPGATESDALLATLTTEAQAAIGDIRRLVYDLRPPDLDEYGLISALHEYLHRIQPRGVIIRLDAPATVPPLPAAVEVAIYRIVQEAVNNGVKHAQADTITVTLTLLEDDPLPLSLQVEICDNGIGLAADHAIGIGLHSMRERAEELGGSYTIGNREKGGTTVVAQLPLA